MAGLLCCLPTGEHLLSVSAVSVLLVLRLHSGSPLLVQAAAGKFLALEPTCTTFRPVCRACQVLLLQLGCHRALTVATFGCKGRVLPTVLWKHWAALHKLSLCQANSVRQKRQLLPMPADPPEANGAQQNCIKRIAVFCGFSSGNRPEYVQIAQDLGAEMVKRNLGLVYGGGAQPCLLARRWRALSTSSTYWYLVAWARRKQRADGRNCKNCAGGPGRAGCYRSHS